MKKVLYVASEAVPFIKTGGLADVVGSLPKCFPKEYFDVRVVIPKYACMKQEFKDRLHYITNFYMDLNWRQQYVGIFEMEYEGIKFPPHAGNSQGWKARSVCGCHCHIRQVTIRVLRYPDSCTTADMVFHLFNAA